MEGSGQITRLLRELGTGNKSAESALMEAVYPELRRMAARYMSHERAGHTLQATALVNEAYLELVGQAGTDFKNRSHFYAVAAQAMRRILVDYAREKKALKRDGDRQRVELTDALAVSRDHLDQILQIDEALINLASWDPRQARVVELRFFGGLSVEETAEVLGITARTVKRDWSVARAWLYGQLAGTGAQPRSPDVSR
jgi:RNA polymerase sigma-70 factor, ECF subfamily